MNLRVVILPAKVLKDGSHKIRIAVSHNSETRYFLTRFNIPSEKNLKNGSVVGLPNSAYINQQLRNRMTQIYMAYDELDTAEYLTCSQLVDVISNKMNKGKKQTFSEIAGEWLELKKKRCASDTIRIYKAGIDLFKEYAGENYVLSILDSKYVYEYREWLEKDKGLNQTTQNMRIGTLRNIVYFGTTHGYCKYDIPPFFDYKEKPNLVRQITLSIDELRSFRDAKITSKWSVCARDIFMLSFYLCGMNFADIYDRDFNLSYVSFIRRKTRSRRDPGDLTEFDIQPEAREILDRYTENGRIKVYDRKTLRSLQHVTDDFLKTAKEEAGAPSNLIYYSARKTFSQIANELQIKDSIIEYCLGDAPVNPHRALSHYIKVTKRMADKAIREIFDFVASDKTVDQWLNTKDNNL